MSLVEREPGSKKVLVGCTHFAIIYLAEVALCIVLVDQEIWEGHHYPSTISFGIVGVAFVNSFLSILN